MMPLCLRFWAARKLRQAASIACVPFVFAFIAFNVLDLDGSNLSSLTKCFERLMIDGDLVTVPDVNPVAERIEYPCSDSSLATNDSKDHARFRVAVQRPLSPLERARRHHYLVSLPRDDVPG
jgi:hypothetical protein